MDEFIKLSIDRIKLFNLPINVKDEQIGIVIIVNSIKETENEIVIGISYWDQELNKEIKQINLSYNKNKLSPHDYILIGWFYIVYYKNFTENGEHYKNTAKEFLIKSIKKGVNSCLPHYLLANYPLNYVEGINRLDSLYSALDVYDDTFPDFYSLVYKKDKYKIRAVRVLKKGLEKFPTSFILNYHLSNYLIRKKNYKEALKFLRNINLKEYKDYGDRLLIGPFSNVFMCNLNLGDFSDSMIMKLKYLKCRIYDRVSETFMDISLKDCTKTFIKNYKNRIEEIFFEKKELKEIYVKEQLPLDIEDLFSMKRYDVIKSLYFYLREDIDFDNSDYLFEIAYSLKKEEYVDEAEIIYNKILESEPKNTSVLNNLAIIFEGKGELDKAIDLIKKAKDLDQKDIVIIDNFNRIAGLVKHKKGKKRKIKFEIKQKPKLHFNTEKSRIFYGNKFCEIPISTYEYYLCEAIFSKPLGTKISEEEIFEVLDRAKLVERSRTIYDTCLRINKKVESSLGLKKILINRGAMIWIRDEFIK